MASCFNEAAALRPQKGQIVSHFHNGEQMLQ